MNKSDKMKVDSLIPEFSVFGGPLNRLGERMGLVKAGTDSSWYGAVIGLSTWSILMVLTLLQGSAGKVFAVSYLAGHVRLLVVIPLFFICEAWVAPRMAEFVRNIVNSGLVPETDLPKLEITLRRINRIKNSWVVEAFLFLLMFVVPLFETSSFLPGKTASASWIIEQAGGHLTLPNVFYLWFCLPLFRFLMARWFWHLGLWWYFLIRMKKLRLRLLPTHSDGVGGLGYLEVVQEHFTPLAMAFSAILAGSLAEEIISGTMQFESLYYLIPIVLLLNLVFFVGPLLLFSHKLWACRIKGLNEYMAMAHHYAEAFDQTWLRDKTVTGQSQLGTSDIQSLADLTNSVRVIRDMRTILVNKRLLIAYSVAVILPFVPFVFVKFSVAELVVKLFQIIAG
jgi:hypothetical protein